MKKYIILFVIIMLIVGYYTINPTYTKSIEAKAYYEMGEYQKAYQLAKEAYKQNSYNTMAFTVLTQSKISLRWIKFIKDSNNYFSQIDSISNKKIISKADKIRIKMMLEIILGEYKNLPHSKLTDKSLINQANKQYKKAKELYDGIFKKRD